MVEVQGEGDEMRIASRATWHVTGTGHNESLFRIPNRSSILAAVTDWKNVEIEQRGDKIGLKVVHLDLATQFTPAQTSPDAKHGLSPTLTYPQERHHLHL